MHAQNQLREDTSQVNPPSAKRGVHEVDHPLVRLALFGLIMLSLFHWAHRFRYTLYDGLQLIQLTERINVGGAFEYVDLGNAKINSSTLQGDYQDNRMIAFALHVGYRF